LVWSFHITSLNTNVWTAVASRDNHRTRTKATIVLIIAFQEIIPFSASIFCAQGERKMAPSSVYESSNFTVG